MVALKNAKQTCRQGCVKPNKTVPMKPLIPLSVSSTGMVTIESPNTTVCYQSSPMLKCTLEEDSDSASWNLSTKLSNFELNNGSVVRLNSSCSNDKQKSCLAVTLHKVTGSWAGKFQVHLKY